MNNRIYAPDPEADYYNAQRQFDVPRSFIGTGYTNWWTAAWREGNLLVAGANMISEAYQHSQYDQNTEFVKDFAQNKERYLGSFAQYEGKYAALSAPKSLEHLEFTKRLIARNVRERAKLNSVGFTEGLLPFLAIGTVSPENWVPLAGAARLGFLGKASLGMRGLQKVFPSIRRNAAQQLDELMTPAFVNQAKAAFPGISQEAIEKMAIQNVIDQSPLMHKIGATALEGVGSAGAVEWIYRLDNPEKPMAESIAIVAGSGVFGASFGALFGGIGSAYGKVLGDKLGLESMTQFRLDTAQQVGQEWGEVNRRLEAEGLPSIIDTMSEEVGVPRADRPPVDDALQQPDLDALDAPDNDLVNSRRQEIIKEVIAERSPDSPIAKLIGLGNDSTWYGKFLFRAMTWSPNLRSAWVLTKAEDEIYRTLGANAMTRESGAADVLGDLTKPSMDTAETLSSMEGMRRVVELGEVYDQNRTEMGGLSEGEWRSVVAKRARRFEFIETDELSLALDMLPNELDGNNRVYGELDGKTPEQIQAIVNSVNKAVDEIYIPYIDEVSKIFQAVGMLHDMGDEATMRRHAANYVTRMYDKPLVGQNRPQFKKAVLEGLIEMRDVEMPRLTETLEALENLINESKAELQNVNLMRSDLLFLRSRIKQLEELRDIRQSEINAFNLLDDQNRSSAMLDQVIRNITGDRVLYGGAGGSPEVNALMPRVLNLRDEYVEPFLINDIGTAMTDSVKKHYPQVVAYRYLASKDQYTTMALVTQKWEQLKAWEESHKQKINDDAISTAEKAEWETMANDLVMEINYLRGVNGMNLLSPSLVNAGDVPVVNALGDLDLDSANANYRHMLEAEREIESEDIAIGRRIEELRQVVDPIVQTVDQHHALRMSPPDRQRRQPSAHSNPTLMESIAHRIVLDRHLEQQRRLENDPAYQQQTIELNALTREYMGNFQPSRLTDEEIAELNEKILADAPENVRDKVGASLEEKRQVTRSNTNEEGTDIQRNLQDMHPAQYLAFVVDRVLHTRVGVDRANGGYIYPMGLTDIATRDLLDAILDNSRGGYLYRANQVGVPRGQVEFVAGNTKAIISGFYRADASSAVHEQMHTVRRMVFNKEYVDRGKGDITEHDLDVAANWSAKEAGVELRQTSDGEYIWTTEMEEAFAQGFEAYVMEGVAPTNALKTVFETLARILSTIYQRLTLSGALPELTDEMREVYGKIVQRNEFLHNNNHPKPDLDSGQKDMIVKAFNLQGEDEIDAVHAVLDSMGLDQSLITYENPTIAEYFEQVRRLRERARDVDNETDRLSQDDIFGDMMVPLEEWLERSAFSARTRRWSNEQEHEQSWATGRHPLAEDAIVRFSNTAMNDAELAEFAANLPSIDQGVADLVEDTPSLNVPRNMVRYVRRAQNGEYLEPDTTGYFDTPASDLLGVSDSHYDPTRHGRGIAEEASRQGAIFYSAVRDVQELISLLRDTAHAGEQDGLFESIKEQRDFYRNLLETARPPEILGVPATLQDLHEHFKNTAPVDPVSGVQRRTPWDFEMFDETWVTLFTGMAHLDADRQGLTGQEKIVYVNSVLGSGPDTQLSVSHLFDYFARDLIARNKPQFAHLNAELLKLLNSFQGSSRPVDVSRHGAMRDSNTLQALEDMYELIAYRTFFTLMPQEMYLEPIPGQSQWSSGYSGWSRQPMSPDGTTPQPANLGVTSTPSRPHHNWSQHTERPPRLIASLLGYKQLFTGAYALDDQVGRGRIQHEGRSFIVTGLQGHLPAQVQNARMALAQSNDSNQSMISEFLNEAIHRPQADDATLDGRVRAIQEIYARGNVDAETENRQAATEITSGVHTSHRHSAIQSATVPDAQMSQDWTGAIYHALSHNLGLDTPSGRQQVDASALTSNPRHPAFTLLHETQYSSQNGPMGSLSKTESESTATQNTYANMGLENAWAPLTVENTVEQRPPASARTEIGSRLLTNENLTEHVSEMRTFLEELERGNSLSRNDYFEIKPEVRTQTKHLLHRLNIDDFNFSHHEQLFNSRTAQRVFYAMPELNVYLANMASMDPRNNVMGMPQEVLDALTLSDDDKSYLSNIQNALNRVNNNDAVTAAEETGAWIDPLRLNGMLRKQLQSLTEKFGELDQPTQREREWYEESIQDTQRHIYNLNQTFVTAIGMLEYDAHPDVAGPSEAFNIISDYVSQRFYRTDDVSGLASTGLQPVSPQQAQSLAFQMMMYPVYAKISRMASVLKPSSAFSLPPVLPTLREAITMRRGTLSENVQDFSGAGSNVGQEMKRRGVNSEALERATRRYDDLVSSLQSARNTSTPEPQAPPEPVESPFVDDADYVMRLKTDADDGFVVPYEPGSLSKLATEALHHGYESPTGQMHEEMSMEVMAKVSDNVLSESTFAGLGNLHKRAVKVAVNTPYRALAQVLRKYTPEDVTKIHDEYKEFFNALPRQAKAAYKTIVQQQKVLLRNDKLDTPGPDNNYVHNNLESVTAFTVAQQMHAHMALSKYYFYDMPEEHVLPLPDRKTFEQGGESESESVQAQALEVLKNLGVRAKIGTKAKDKTRHGGVQHKFSTSHYHWPTLLWDSDADVYAERLHEVTAQGHTVHNFATKRYKSVEHAKKLLPDLRVVDIPDVPSLDTIDAILSVADAVYGTTVAHTIRAVYMDYLARLARGQKTKSTFDISDDTFLQDLIIVAKHPLNSDVSWHANERLTSLQGYTQQYDTAKGERPANLFSVDDYSMMAEKDTIRIMSVLSNYDLKRPEVLKTNGDREAAVENRHLVFKGALSGVGSYTGDTANSNLACSTHMTTSGEYKVAGGASSVGNKPTSSVSHLIEMRNPKVIASHAFTTSVDDEMPKLDVLADGIAEDDRLVVLPPVAQNTKYGGMTYKNRIGQIEELFNRSKLLSHDDPELIADEQAYAEFKKHPMVSWIDFDFHVPFTQVSADTGNYQNKDKFKKFQALYNTVMDGGLNMKPREHEFSVQFAPNAYYGTESSDWLVNMGLSLRTENDMGTHVFPLSTEDREAILYRLYSRSGASGDLFQLPSGVAKTVADYTPEEMEIYEASSTISDLMQHPGNKTQVEGLRPRGESIPNELYHNNIGRGREQKGETAQRVRDMVASAPEGERDELARRVALAVHEMTGSDEGTYGFLQIGNTNRHSILAPTRRVNSQTISTKDTNTPKLQSYVMHVKDGESEVEFEFGVRTTQEYIDDGYGENVAYLEGPLSDDYQQAVDVVIGSLSNLKNFYPQHFVLNLDASKPAHKKIVDLLALEPYSRNGEAIPNKYVASMHRFMPSLKEIMPEMPNLVRYANADTYFGLVNMRLRSSMFKTKALASKSWRQELDTDVKKITDIPINGNGLELMSPYHSVKTMHQGRIRPDGTRDLNVRPKDWMQRDSLNYVNSEGKVIGHEEFKFAHLDNKMGQSMDAMLDTNSYNAMRRDYPLLGEITDAGNDVWKPLEHYRRRMFEAAKKHLPMQSKGFAEERGYSDQYMNLNKIIEEAKLNNLGGRWAGAGYMVPSLFPHAERVMKAGSEVDTAILAAQQAWRDSVKSDPLFLSARDSAQSTLNGMESYVDNDGNTVFVLSEKKAYDARTLNAERVQEYFDNGNDKVDPNVRVSLGMFAGEDEGLSPRNVVEKFVVASSKFRFADDQMQTLHSANETIMPNMKEVSGDYEAVVRQAAQNGYRRLNPENLHELPEHVRSMANTLEGDMVHKASANGVGANSGVTFNVYVVTNADNIIKDVRTYEAGEGFEAVVPQLDNLKYHVSEALAVQNYALTMATLNGAQGAMIPVPFQAIDESIAFTSVPEDELKDLHFNAYATLKRLGYTGVGRSDDVLSVSGQESTTMLLSFNHHTLDDTMLFAEPEKGMPTVHDMLYSQPTTQPSTDELQTIGYQNRMVTEGDDELKEQMPGRLLPAHNIDRSARLIGSRYAQLTQNPAGFKRGVAPGREDSNVRRGTQFAQRQRVSPSELSYQQLTNIAQTSQTSNVPDIRIRGLQDLLTDSNFDGGSPIVKRIARDTGRPEEEVLQQIKDDYAKVFEPERVTTDNDKLRPFNTTEASKRLEQVLHSPEWAEYMFKERTHMSDELSSYAPAEAKDMRNGVPRLNMYLQMIDYVLQEQKFAIQAGDSQSARISLDPEVDMSIARGHDSSLPQPMGGKSGNQLFGDFVTNAMHGVDGTHTSSVAERARYAPHALLKDTVPMSLARDRIMHFNKKQNMQRLLTTDRSAFSPLARNDRLGSDSPYDLLRQEDIPEMDYDHMLYRAAMSDPKFADSFEQMPSDLMHNVGKKAAARLGTKRAITRGVANLTGQHALGEIAGNAPAGSRAKIELEMPHTAHALKNHENATGTRVLRQEDAGNLRLTEREQELKQAEAELEALQLRRRIVRESLSDQRRALRSVAQDMASYHDESSRASRQPESYLPLPAFRVRDADQGSYALDIKNFQEMLAMRINKVKADTFKDALSLEAQFTKIDREYEPLIREAEESPNRRTSKGQTVRDLIKRKQMTKKDARAMLERILGTHGHQADPSEFASRLSATARDFNYMRMMGGVALSSLPDLAMAVSTAGLRHYFGAWGEMLRGNLLEKKGQDNNSRDSMSHLLYAAETVLGEFRANKTHMIDESLDPSASRFERMVHAGAGKFGELTGIRQWNGAMKAVAASAIQSRMIEIGYKVKANKASMLEKELMRQFGVSPEAAVSFAEIHEQMGETGTTMLGSKFYHARLDRWRGAIGKYSAEEIENLHRQWRLATVQAVNRTIVTPSVGDLPLTASGSPLGKMLFQFKSFSMAATQQVLISGLQRGIGYGDMSQLTLLLSLTSLGSMVYIIREMLSGRDPFADEENWLNRMMLEGLDRGGALGILTEANQILEKVAGFGLSNLTQSGPLTRYMQRNKLDALLGPSFGLFGDLLDAGGMTPQWLMNDRETSKGQATSLRRLLPYQNLLQTRFMLDVAPNLAGQGGYFNDWKSIQERIRTGDWQ